MPANTLSSKVACLNPNTGRSMNIDKATYDLFSKAIFHTLKKRNNLTFTEIVDGVRDCFREQKTKFEGAVDWYSITVKNDMHARKVIEVFTEKGKKIHRIKKKGTILLWPLRSLSSGLPIRVYPTILCRTAY